MTTSRAVALGEQLGSALLAPSFAAGWLITAPVMRVRHNGHTMAIDAANGSVI